MQTDVITKRVVLWFFFLYQPQFCLSAPPRSLSCRHVGDKPSDLLHPGCGRILLKDHDLSCTNTTRRSQEAGDNRLRLIWDVRVLSEPEITKGFSCSPSFLWNKSTPSEKGPSDLLWNCINETLEHNRRKTFWAFFFQLFVFIDTESLSWSSTPVTTLESVAVAPMYKSHLLSVSYSISVFLKMQWKVGYIYTLYICVDICSYIVWYISAENTRHLDTFEILTRINRCANENTR